MDDVEWDDVNEYFCGVRSSVDCASGICMCRQNLRAPASTVNRIILYIAQHIALVYSSLIGSHRRIHHFNQQYTVSTAVDTKSKLDTYGASLDNDNTARIYSKDKHDSK